ncbi:hypothetical protein P22_3443 [Propionispora sp. 2/2-37]|uniref:hypothetical protein n=1 Tax=Propionispora sp. 2/2-37 TaxID=1677858 RepID=UPI0006BB770F|nr:hypothetical protein [Propionispora sp. 2/2-37]CUH97316.1 hypothetical protein P22_3443 [Propionispora sp. 2/2-37]
MWQKYGIVVLHEHNVHVTSHEIRDWLEKVLAGKVARFVGYTEEMTNYLPEGEAIVGCLVVKDERSIAPNEMMAYVTIPHEKWKVTEVMQRG